MASDIEIRLMQSRDLETLHAICCAAYSQNFNHHWEPGGLENYLENVFGINVLENELTSPKIQYHVAFVEKEPVAFMKLNLSSNLPELDNGAGLELEKIYILPEYKGIRIGRKLIDLAFQIARIHKKEILWLAVIDTNREAIAFYKKTGFKFHSKTQADYPKFKRELRGMWRMYFDLSMKKIIA